MRCKRCDAHTNMEYCRACTKKLFPGKRNAKRRAIRAALENISLGHSGLGWGYYGHEGVKAPGLHRVPRV